MFFSFFLQAAMIAVSVVLAGAGWSGLVGGAVMFGGAVALTSSGLLVWRWHRGREVYHCDGERHLKTFQRSARERFWVVAVLMAAGFVVLDLAPLPVLTGFIVGQLAWVIAAAVRKTD